MDGTKHTLEPWELIGYSIYGGDKSYICYLEDMGDDDARRIIACVNHCAGISTEALESGPSAAELAAHYPDPEEASMLKSRVNALQDSLDYMTERAHKAEAQRDALLAAADAIIAEVEGGRPAETLETPYAPKATRYDWSKAPEWAKFAATDLDGKVTCWEGQPIPSMFDQMWKHGGSGRQWLPAHGWDTGAPCPDWLDSLEARP